MIKILYLMRNNTDDDILSVLFFCLNIVSGHKCLLELLSLTSYYDIREKSQKNHIYTIDPEVYSNDMLYTRN